MRKRKRKRIPNWVKDILLIISSPLVFAVVTLYTAKLESGSDGNDTYGFPLTFYIEYGGKRNFYPPNPFYLNNLLTDLGFAILITTVFWIVVSFILLKFCSHRFAAGAKK